jgi:hypothetical protein
VVPRPDFSEGRAVAGNGLGGWVYITVNSQGTDRNVERGVEICRGANSTLDLKTGKRREKKNNIHRVYTMKHR